mgnify:CR=1 FL=1
MSNNNQLSVFLKEIKAEVSAAQSSKDWESIFSKIKSYPGPIKYSYTTEIVMLVLAVLGGAIQGFFTNQGQTWGMVYSLRGDQAIFLMLTLVGLIAIIAISSKASTISEISDNIFNKDVFWDNQLEEVSNEGKHAEYKELFSDFNRGDQDRKIRKVIKGKFKGEDHSLDYELYKFSYVVVTYRTVKVGKATTVQRVETTYYRYGMVCDFPFLKANVLIGEDLQGSYKQSWETTSQDFNRRFNIYTTSEHEVAKFLSPSTIQAFNNGIDMGSMNFEFVNGRLCISFSDSDVYSLERTFGIDKINEFEKEIKEKQVLPKLQELLALVHKLMANSDNNFK